MKRYGITVGDNIKLNVRLVDCVGYLVNNAIGYLEDDMPRMVKTPWSTEEIPFEQAAEIGTKKVIQEHSTIGILVTTDGSVTGIEREDYIEPEERVVKELKELNKPFVIVLNSVEPDSEYTQTLAQKLQEKYDTQVIPTDCENLTADKIDEIFGKVLYEFPIERVNISFPRWVDGLPETHWLKEELYDEIKGGYIDRMSFQFTIREQSYDKENHMWTVRKVKRLYDVSAVDIPAYDDTSIEARKNSILEADAQEQSERKAAAELSKRKLQLKMKLSM